MVGAGVPRLVFEARVDGAIRTGATGGLPYVYVVALNLSTDDVPTTTGPVPIVVPSGNGIVAGEATHYVLWNPLGSPQYQIYQFRDSTLQQSFVTGTPVVSRPVLEGDDVVRFEIDLTQLVLPTQVSSIRSVQVNFLTMNNTNTAGGGRVWDALGDGRNPTQVNSPFTFRLNTSQIYRNATSLVEEPAGDAVDPDLDLVDWLVEVRLR